MMASIVSTLADGSLVSLWLEVAVEATLVLLLTFAASVLLRGASSEVRHLVWTAGLSIALLLPAVTVGWPVHTEFASWIPAPAGIAEAPVAPVSGAPEEAPAEPAPPRGAEFEAEPVAERESGAATAPAAGSSSAPGVESEPAADGGTAWSPAALMLALWLAGAFVVLGRMVWGLVALRRFRTRSSLPEAPNLSRLAREAAVRLGVESAAVRETGEIDVPLTVGVVKPAVLLPTGAAKWEPERLRSVLLHELAHVRRRDPMQHLLARLACALHWYNPLVWLAARGQRRESERACDDAVLRAGVRPSTYASHLLDVAAVGVGRPVHSLALSMARQSDFEGRLLDVLDPGRRRGSPPAYATVVAAAVVLVTTLGLATVAARPAASDPPEAVPSEARAGAAPGAHAAVARDSSGRAVLEALIALLDDPDPAVRAAGARSLGDRRASDAVLDLIGALSDPAPRVRVQAAAALADLEDERAVRPLGERLVQDDEVEVRRAAAAALGEVETDESVRVLADALPDIADRKTDAYAVRALGETRRESAVPILAGLLDAEDRWIQREALKALAEIGTSAAAQVLVGALEDENAYVRRKAARALGGIR